MGRGVEEKDWEEGQGKYARDRGEGVREMGRGDMLKEQGEGQGAGWRDKGQGGES